nr:MAG TPA: hypothetical protein [Caudoviricetes sp.]
MVYDSDMPILTPSSDDNISLHQIIGSLQNFPSLCKKVIIWNIPCISERSDFPQSCYFIKIELC